MAKPSIEQVTELFRQIESGRISSVSLQVFLERKVRGLSLDEFRVMMGIRCNRGSCRGFLNSSLGHYEHSDGWIVEGFKERQWLYTICGSCGDETSLQHYGVHKDLIVAERK